MSLFPAYGASPQVKQANDSIPLPAVTADSLNWLNNQSFAADSLVSRATAVSTKSDGAGNDLVIPSSTEDARKLRKHEQSTNEGSDEDIVTKKLKKLRHEHDKHHSHKKNKKHRDRSHSGESGRANRKRRPVNDEERSHKRSRSRDKNTRTDRKHDEKRNLDVTKSHETTKLNEPLKQLSDTLTQVFVAPPGKVFLSDLPGLRTVHAFRIDRIPDVNNITYGGIYRMHIARYRRRLWKNGGCLGLAFSETDVKVPSVDRYYSLKNSSGVSATSSGRYVGPRNQFLSRSKRRRFTDTIAPSFIPIGTDDGTSTDGGAKPAESVENSEISGVTEERSASRLKMIEFSKKLDADPENVMLWKEFVRFQSTETLRDALAEGVTPDRMASTVAEIKSSVLDRALEKNPGNVELKLLQLDVCEGLWDAEKLASEWKRLVFTHANDGFIWRCYLRRVRSYFRSFTTSGLVSAYVRAITTLRGAHDGTLLSHRALPHTTEHMIDLFDELCHVLRGAGHMEKAVAFYQSQLEFNLCRPAVLGPTTPHKDAIDFMSVYWDSAAPKLGEEASGGWAAWVDSGGEHATGAFWYSKESDETAEQKIITNQQDSVVEQCRSGSWVAVETSRDDRHWLPWRPDLDRGESSIEDCEDPERVVVFDDISAALFFLQSERDRFRLVLSFLRFLDSSIFDKLLLFGSGSSCLETLSCILEMSGDSPLSNIWRNCEEVFRKQDCDSVFGGVLLSGSNPELLRKFTENVFEQLLRTFSGKFRSLLTLLYVDFKMAEFHRLKSSGDKRLMKQHSRDLRKFFKSLLKMEHNRSDLAVWEKYARFEWLSGNPDDARRVFETAVAMIGSEFTKIAADNDRSRSVIQLFRSYVLLELQIDDTLSGTTNFCIGQRQNKSEAESPLPNLENSIQILIRLVDLSTGGRVEKPAVVTPAGQVRARHFYQRKFDEFLVEFDSASSAVSQHALSIGNSLVDWSVCFAAFEYITSGISSATEVFKKLMSTLKPSTGLDSAVCDVTVSDKVTVENFGTGTVRIVDKSVSDRYRDLLLRRCTEMYVIFLRFHVSNNAAPVSLLRDPLSTALGRFPEDFRLLEMFIDVEASSSIAGRLRAYFHRALDNVASPVPFLCAVLAKRRRMARVGSVANSADYNKPGNDFVETGITHQLRSWFERAVNHESVKRCALIWRLYMHFEAELKHYDRVKTVFYRSLQCCPWAKVLYVDCVRLVPDMLQEVTDLMTEKEVRLRTPLEEVDLLLAAAVAASRMLDVADSGTGQLVDGRTVADSAVDCVTE